MCGGECRGDKVELASCRIDLDLLVIFSCVAHTPRWPVAAALEQREKNFKVSHTHTHTRPDFTLHSLAARSLCILIN